MKIVISQQVSLNDFKKGWFTMRKTITSDIIPHKGDYITDSVWRDPYEYEVIENIIDYSENSCYVQVQRLVLETNDKDYLNQ